MKLLREQARGRIMRTVLPSVTESGREVIGRKHLRCWSVRTGSISARKRFFRLCEEYGLTAKRLSYSGCKATAEDDLRAAVGTDEIRKAYRKDDSMWAWHTDYQVFGNKRAIDYAEKVFGPKGMEPNDDIRVLDECSYAVDVRPPMGLNPPAPHLPSPPAKRENGQGIPTVLQQHVDYKASTLYPQNS